MSTLGQGHSDGVREQGAEDDIWTQVRATESKEDRKLHNGFS